MADLRNLKWWIAKEIPFVEWDWRSIRNYLPLDERKVLQQERCVYVVRMSPPFLVSYNNGESPVVYVGSGKIGQRWSTHRDWLHEIGLSLPGARYEVWICVPRAKNNPDVDDDVEADILGRFFDQFKMRPLQNIRIEKNARTHRYAGDFFSKVFDVTKDRRYRWAVWPWGKNSLVERFNRCNEIEEVS